MKKDTLLCCFSVAVIFLSYTNLLSMKPTISEFEKEKALQRYNSMLRQLHKTEDYTNYSEALKRLLDGDYMNDTHDTNEDFSDCD